MWYILKDKNPVHCKDVQKAATWFEEADRHVARTIINGYEISTVFLGLDHNFSDKGEPLLFETMVFKEGDYSSSSDMFRYSTWEAAEAGHKKMVEQYS